MDSMKDALIKAFGPNAAKEWLPTPPAPPEPEPKPENPNEDSLGDMGLILEIQKQYQPPPASTGPSGKTANQGNSRSMSDQQTRWGAAPKGKMVNK